MRLPLKTRIFEYGIERNEPFTIEELMRDLEKEYLDQRQFTKKRVETYIMSYCGVDIMEAKEMESELKFCITKYGRQNEKYIPGHK